MQKSATHPKTARREEKSDKKKEERIGAQLKAEITEPTDDTGTAAAVSACVSAPAWKPSSSHLQSTWALRPERKCGDHTCTPAVDLAALSQLTAWVERLDAINHMNAGEDQMILKIRTRAVRVLDLWAQRWYARHAMWDDEEADPSAVGAL